MLESRSWKMAFKDWGWEGDTHSFPLISTLPRPEFEFSRLYMDSRQMHFGKKKILSWFKYSSTCLIPHSWFQRSHAGSEIRKGYSVNMQWFVIFLVFNFEFHFLLYYTEITAIVIPQEALYTTLTFTINLCGNIIIPIVQIWSCNIRKLSNLLKHLETRFGLKKSGPRTHVL